MNKYEKEVEQILLNNEKQVLKDLEKTYTQALADIKTRLKNLMSREDAENQNVIYQINFQKQLESQITAIVNLLKEDVNINTSSYLTKMYEDSFIGNMYNMSKSYNINTIIGIDENAVLKSIEKPIENMTFAQRTNINMDDFKKSVKSEISRGLANGSSYIDISKHLAMVTDGELYKSYRIARTEGLRVKSEAKLDSSKQLNKKYGADLVKQWDSTLDGNTRPEHQELDGQIKELDEYFECSGGKTKAPGLFGNPAMDCNCRCTMLQIPRWAIGIPLTKIDNANPFKEDGIVNLIDGKDYNEYKKKYFKYLENGDKITVNNLFDKIDVDINNYHYSKPNNIQENVAKLLKIDKLPTIVNDYEFKEYQRSGN